MSVAQCLAKHPESEATCYLPAERAHNYHLAHPGLNWPNPDYVPPPTPIKKAKFTSDANKIKDGIKRNARHSDPSTSKQAAERYEPKRETAKGRVLAHLRAHPNEWVDAPEFTREDIGGFAGTRRLRELREDDGWPIETRPKPGYTNLWQHRLLVGAEEVQASTLSD